VTQTLQPRQTVLEQVRDELRNAVQHRSRVTLVVIVRVSLRRLGADLRPGADLLLLAPNARWRATPYRGVRRASLHPREPLVRWRIGVLVPLRLPRTILTSRMRRDAAIYEQAPPRTGRRGRPRTKGARLPIPAKLAPGLKGDAFEQVSVE
jgi:hypothetical protein